MINKSGIAVLGFGLGTTSLGFVFKIINVNKMISTETEKSKVTLRRLLLSKQLYLHGLSHSHQNDALSKMIAVHNFHNAIEITLRSIILHYEIRGEKQLNIEFETMLNEVDNYEKFKEISKKIPYRQELRNLNQLRNMVQHHAVEPEESMMDEWRVFSKRFLVKSFQDFFEIDYDEISALLLINGEDICSLLKISSTRLSEGKWDDSICFTKLAFEYAAISLTKYLPFEGFNSPFFALSDLRHTGSDDISKVKKAIEKVYERIDDIQHYSAILSSGVRLSDYKRFEKNTPRIMFAITGYPHLTGKTYTEEDARWAFSFASETLLAWQIQGLDPEIPENYLDTCKTIIEKESFDLNVIRGKA